MDNESVHSKLEMMQFYSNKKIKVLFNTPYISYFNMVEFCFRSLKAIIYNKLFSSIVEIRNKLIDLLKSEEIKKRLPYLFKETLKQYIIFIDYNLSFNLSFN